MEGVQTILNVLTVFVQDKALRTSEVTGTDGSCTKCTGYTIISILMVNRLDLQYIALSRTQWPTKHFTFASHSPIHSLILTPMAVLATSGHLDTWSGGNLLVCLQTNLSTNNLHEPLSHCRPLCHCLCLNGE